jgi:hypothetical protein
MAPAPRRALTRQRLSVWPRSGSSSSGRGVGPVATAVPPPGGSWAGSAPGAQPATPVAGLLGEGGAQAAGLLGEPGRPEGRAARALRSSAWSWRSHATCCLFR